MSSALARLKEKIAQTPLPDLPSKPSKAPFEGFEGDTGRGVAPLRMAAADEHSDGEATSSADRTSNPYADSLVDIIARGPPAGVPEDRWPMFLADGKAFLEIWGKQAAALEWGAEDLFGLDAHAPMARYDRMGLLWILRGERVVALTETAAKLSGGLSYRRRPAK